MTRSTLAFLITGLVLAGVVLGPKDAALHASVRGRAEKQASIGFPPEYLLGTFTAVKQGALALVQLQCDNVFSEVDHDGDGKLDEAELHVAVLLVYGRLNQMMGGMAFKLPRAHEIKKMLAAADDGDGTLTRTEFKRFFTSMLGRRLAALVSARLLTQKVLIPAGAVSINLLTKEMEVTKRFEDLVTSSFGSANIVTRRVKTMATSKVLQKLGPAVGPLFSLAAAGAIVNGIEVEKHLARAFDSGELGELHM